MTPSCQTTWPLTVAAARKDKHSPVVCCDHWLARSDSGHPFVLNGFPSPTASFLPGNLCFFHFDVFLSSRTSPFAIFDFTALWSWVLKHCWFYFSANSCCFIIMSLPFSPSPADFLPHKVHSHVFILLKFANLLVPANTYPHLLLSCDDNVCPFSFTSGSAPPLKSVPTPHPSPNSIHLQCCL